MRMGAMVAEKGGMLYCFSKTVVVDVTMHSYDQEMVCR